MAASLAVRPVRRDLTAEDLVAGVSTNRSRSSTRPASAPGGKRHLRNEVPTARAHSQINAVSAPMRHELVADAEARPVYARLAAPSRPRRGGPNPNHLRPRPFQRLGSSLWWWTVIHEGAARGPDQWLRRHRPRRPDRPESPAGDKRAAHPLWSQPQTRGETK